ncbi:MAG TPA: acyclic terpene utilization AtuA family protein [Acidimicrobiia bacterium]|nr:acyclic terpene utilization AtuA family protein [Acidimicrobiia bacterium]
MPADRIVIANCGGFWGDDPTAARRQVEGGPVDYLVMDYLAEVTMAILQKQRQRKPDAGYATDFLTQLRDVLPTCVERGIKVISNAGGVNPLACKAAVEKLAGELGIGDRVRVGVVLGDDIYDRLDDLIASGETLNNMETGRPLSDERSNVLSANVYLGAAPVVKALELGANVVITGRVTDTGVTLAPMIYEFGWAQDDWNRLAAGIVAGHVIECGTQCTGGNFTDWQKVKSFSNLGYPLVEAMADGTFTVTKHPGTGGIVSVHSISEQLLYEMGAPQYLAPDCIARFDSIRLSQDGPDRVKVSGVVGEPPPEKLKVSVSFSHGYRAFGRLVVTGPDTLAKAEKVAQLVWESAGGTDLYEDTATQFLAWNATHPPLTDSEPSEIMVQLAVRDSDAGKINNRFGVQVVPRVLGSVPGITVLADQGRPRASDVVGYWPALIDRSSVPMRVVVGDDEVEAPYLDLASAAPAGPTFTPDRLPSPTGGNGGPTVKVPLSRLCLARSGDKGDTSNVGVIARSQAIYGWMLENLTAPFVKQRFAGVCKGEVERHEVPNLLACNFLLHESLGGGGTMSLILDAQGKTYAQYLLAAEVEVDASLLDGVE